MWYVRSLPGVVRAFEVAYGEPAVAAYDRMSVNLPTSSGNPAALRVASQTFAHGKLNANGLHTHYNQDGFGDEQLICYAILNLWDMNKAGGASERLPPSLPPSCPPPPAFDRLPFRVLSEPKRPRERTAAIVPGSHKPEKVRAINEMRAACWEGEGPDRKWVGPGSDPGEFLQAFTANGLQPVVLNNR